MLKLVEYLLYLCSAIHPLLLLLQVLVITRRCAGRLEREGLGECSYFSTEPWHVVHCCLTVLWVSVRTETQILLVYVETFKI